MEDITISEILDSVKRRTKLIGLLAIVFGIVAFILFYFVVGDSYSVQTKLVFGRPVTYTEFEENPNYEDVYNDVLLNQKLLATYQEIMKSEKILKQVIQKYDLDITSKDLREQLIVQTVNNTEIISLIVTNEDPQLAVNIANEITSLFLSEVENFQNEVNVFLLDEAQLPDEPDDSGRFRNTLISALFGAFIGVVYAVYLAIADKTIKKVAEVRNYYEFPILGVGIFSRKQNSYNEDSIRSIRTSIQFTMSENDLHSMVVLSTNRNEGRTEFTRALAQSLAANGSRVLLINSDSQSSGIAKKTSDAGLFDILIGKEILQDSIAHKEGISVLQAGNPVQGVAELLDSPKMSEVLREVQTMYDYVILDSPNLKEFADGAVLAKQVDGAVLMLASGKTLKDDFDQAIEKIRNVKGNILGIVFSEER